MKTQKVEFYAILHFGNRLEKQKYKGFAVDHEPRFCVRQNKLGWLAIDWDTGYPLGMYYPSQDEAIESVVAILKTREAVYQENRLLALMHLKDAGLI